MSTKVRSLLRRQAGVLTLLAIAATDALAYRAPPGAGAALLGALVLALLALAFAPALRRPALAALAACALVAIASMAVAPSALNAWLALVLLVALGARCRWRGPWPEQALASVVLFPIVVVHAVWRLSVRRPAGPMPHGFAVGRWLVPGALACVFGAIFVVGDPAFAHAVRAAWLSLADLVLPAPDRVALWMLSALTFAGIVHAVLPGVLRRAVRWWSAASPPHVASGAPALVARCLLVLNALFLVENALGVRHAWLGAALPDGTTLAASAQRGAHALLVAALLSALLVLLAFHPGGATERSPWARGLAMTWLLQVVMLLVSALLRLRAYAEVYALTRWRVAAFLWMALVAVGVALLLARLMLQRGNRWLVGSGAAAALGMLLALSLLDVDGFIARWDVRRCYEAGGAVPLDVGYLESLGPESLPAMIALLERQHAEARPFTMTRLRLETSVSRLSRELEGASSDPRGWSLRAHRLRASVRAWEAASRQ